MRFAVINDVQGNVSALRAVVAAIDEAAPPVERVVALGDLVGRGPHPNEVLEFLRERGIDSVRGNYDDAVAGNRADSGMDFPDPATEEADAQALGWTREVLTPENLLHLQNLPRDIRLFPGFGGVRVQRNTGDETVNEYRRNYFLRALFGGLVRQTRSLTKRVLLVHGSPRALNEFLREDTANTILQAVMRDASADVVITGHAGSSYHRTVGDVTFVGVGSVSGPRTPVGVAEYAIINVGETVETEFRRVEYDADQHLASLREASLPPSADFTPRPA